MTTPAMPELLPLTGCILIQDRTIYVLNKNGENAWWATVYPGFHDNGIRVSDDQCRAVAAELARAAALSSQPSPEQPAAAGVSDDIGKAFYELSCNSWGVAPCWGALNQRERDDMRSAASKFAAILALRPAAQTEREVPRWTVSVEPVAVSGEPDAHCLRASIGNQAFHIGPDYLDTKQEAEFFAEMFLHAIEVGQLASLPAPQQATPERHLTVTTNQQGEAVMVSWQDDEHRILEVVWERKQATPEPVPAEQAKWCEYVAGMVDCWVSAEWSNYHHKDEDRRVKAIAGIIERRLWALQKQPATPEPVQLDVVRQAIEERDAMESRYHELAQSMTYKGNSVAWWHSKATAYRDAINEVWSALKVSGIYADGTKTCADGVRELAARPAPGVPAKLPSAYATSTEDGTWRVLLAFDNKDDAEATRRFLHDHGVPPRTMRSNAPDAFALSRDDFDRCRQWFDCIQNVHGGYLDRHDYELAKELYTALGMRVPHSIDGQLAAAQAKGGAA